MWNHCEYFLFLDCGSLICDTDQEVSAFQGNVSQSAALQKPCLPPVQENQILCNQGEKACFLYSEYERGTDQKVPTWVCFRSPWRVCQSTDANGLLRFFQYNIVELYPKTLFCLKYFVKINRNILHRWQPPPLCHRINPSIFEETSRYRISKCSP